MSTAAGSSWVTALMGLGPVGVPAREEGGGLRIALELPLRWGGAVSRGTGLGLGPGYRIPPIPPLFRH